MLVGVLCRLLKRREPPLDGAHGWDGPVGGGLEPVVVDELVDHPRIRVPEVLLYQPRPQSFGEALLHQDVGEDTKLQSSHAIPVLAPAGQ